MSVTGEPGGAPVKSGVPLTDFAAGLYAAFSIASSLFEKKGRHIDVPMLGTTLAIAALQTSEYFGSGKDPRKLGSAHPRNAPYQAFRCQDGHFVMAAGNDDLFRRACEGFECPILLSEDPKFSSTALRAKNQVELKEILEKTFATLTAEQCLGIARKQGVPCAPINTYSEALADPAGGALRLGPAARIARGAARPGLSCRPLMKEQKARKTSRPGRAHRGGAQAAFSIPSVSMKRDDRRRGPGRSSGW